MIDQLKEPLITVVTVVLNMKEDLEKTIRSVSGQTYENIEYIIVDGGSTDGTLDVIKKYQYAISSYISEPDKGIYDAMNKGIRMASGLWVNFMNAGDVFYNSNSVSSLRNYFQQDTAVIYGDVRIEHNDLERTQYAESFSRLRKGMVCCHQSVFIKKQVLDSVVFDLEYSLAADYDLLCRIYLAGFHATKVDMVISKVIGGGQGDVKRVEVLRQFLMISCKNFKSIATFLNIKYQALISLEYIKLFLKKYLPRNLVYFFIKYKYSNAKK